MTSSTFIFIDKFREVKNLEIIESQSDIKRLSKDFYNYSPILTEKLDECIADLVVRPNDHKAVKEVAEICWEFSIPLTLRGSGTGNYGQAVPLFKGVVMQMSRFNKLEEFDPDTGFVKVQSGCVMGDLNNQLEKYGRELRLLPSTWKTATIGGFIAGGSGGIGSISDLLSLVKFENSGLFGVIVGKALYENKFKISEANNILSSERLSDFDLKNNYYA